MAELLVEHKAGGEPARALRLDRLPFRIGKGPDCDLVLPAAAVSRQHCEIVRQEGALVLRDAGSRNGTWVDGARLAAPLRLRGGERIQLGDWTLTLRADDDGAATRGEDGTRLAPDQPARPAAPAPAGPGLLIPPDLRRSLHRDLLEGINRKRLDLSKMTPAEVQRQTREAIEEIVRRRDAEVPAAVPRERLVQDLLDQALGLGPLEDLLKDPSVSEIMVNRFDRVYVERGGRIELSGRQFLDNPHVIEIIRRIIAPIGRRIDESSPMVDARLPDGSRVNAIIPPLAISGPSITIRKFSAKPLQVADLVRFGSMTEHMGRFLEVCVRHRKNICISGGTGSGKTTLLNVISSFIPGHERIVTIEDAAELRLPQEHVVSLESKPPNLEGEGAIPIRKLVINALRMRPDRIIVGECRGGEALDMLQAMNTGHDGSLTTLHANTCRDAISRLSTMVLMAGMELPAKAIVEQIAAAMDVIVQTSRLPDGSRKVTHIACVDGMEGDVITLQDVFSYRQEGFDARGRVLGRFVASGLVPGFVHELKARGVETDLSIFAS